MSFYIRVHALLKFVKHTSDRKLLIILHNSSHEKTKTHHEEVKYGESVGFLKRSVLFHVFISSANSTTINEG